LIPNVMTSHPGSMPSTLYARFRCVGRVGWAVLPLILLLCTTVLTGCAPDDAERNLGRQMTKLHEQMNGEETSAIWNAADDGFHKGISKQEFTQLFIRNHRVLGDAGGGLTLDTEVYKTYGGTYITQWMITDFANDPDAREHIVWFGTDGVYKLYRYDVSSRLLK
jgi:hypothetical protein